MNLSRLQTFVAVARSGTFAAAADALSFTPSAVSQQMAKLEAEIGTPLLIRDARGAAGVRGRIELTDAGRVLHERAVAILAAVRDAQVEIEALGSDRLSRLRRGSFPAATAGIVPRALRLFRRRLPSTDVELLEIDGRPGLRERRLDLAIEARVVGADATAADPAIAEAMVVREPLSLAMPTGHPLAARAEIALDALDGAVVVGSAAMPEVRELVRRCAAAGAGAGPPAGALERGSLVDRPPLGALARHRVREPAQRSPLRRVHVDQHVDQTQPVPHRHQSEVLARALVAHRDL